MDNQQSQQINHKWIGSERFTDSSNSPSLDPTLGSPNSLCSLHRMRQLTIGQVGLRTASLWAVGLKWKICTKPLSNILKPWGNWEKHNEKPPIHGTSSKSRSENHERIWDNLKIARPQVNVWVNVCCVGWQTNHQTEKLRFWPNLAVTDDPIISRVYFTSKSLVWKPSPIFFLWKW
jgi:hypothetical protein